MIPSELREHFATLLASHGEIWLVYLFGSRVEAETEPERIGPLSDYDFGLLVDRELSPAERDAAAAWFTTQMARRLGMDRIDVVVLNQAPIELAYAVIARGLCLWERDTATRVEYEAYVLGRYGDYLPILREQRTQILKGDDYAKRVQRYREALGRTRLKISEIAAPPE